MLDLGHYGQQNLPKAQQLVKKHIIPKVRVVIFKLLEIPRQMTGAFDRGLVHENNIFSVARATGEACVLSIVGHELHHF